MQNLEADYATCKANVDANAVTLSYSCNTISDSRGVDGCRYTLGLQITAGYSDCAAKKEQTKADCS